MTASSSLEQRANARRERSSYGTGYARSSTTTGILRSVFVWYSS